MRSRLGQRRDAPRPGSGGAGTSRPAIFKEPVPGRIPLRRLNLDGDAQADLTVHGGPDKAIYAYPSEHYDYWRAELPAATCPPAPSART